MSRSVLEASQLGNTQYDRTLAEEKEAREKREEERKESITASGNNLMSKKYIADFEKYKVDGKRVGNYNRPTRYSSPIRTKKGGKSRKHRGSRKNKKSKRR